MVLGIFLYAPFSQICVSEQLLVVAVRTSSQAVQQVQHSSLAPRILALPKAPVMQRSAQ
jgi:hypothetical protein